MSILFFECVLIFGYASGLLGDFGPIIGFPIFMVFIILSSNFWGMKHGKWYGANQKTIKKMITSIFILKIAVIILATANAFQ